jgi:hypothetical protein
MLFGIPAILLTYGLVLWRWAFRPADRALFRKAPVTATIPTEKHKS